VVGVDHDDKQFIVRVVHGWKPGASPNDHSSDTLSARNVVIATGGLSLPKTGSDGMGFEFVRKLGHSIVPTTPGLAPLILDGDFHAGLSGVSHEIEIVVAASGEKPVRLRGAMLWTHFGVSGPAAMNVSRHWERARLEGRDARVTINFLPGFHRESADQRLMALASEHPKMQLHNVLSSLIPLRVAAALLVQLGIKAGVPMAHLSKESRRKLVETLVAFPVAVRGTRGYAHAEVTAGGVPLTEINPATMESRRTPGLYLVGEILDVDGRIGGFNFQWAWSSGLVVGRALAAGIIERNFEPDQASAAGGM
jgi:predicted Rossmann fold flavoprotein